MRTALIAGALAGTTLGLGVVVATDVASRPADAQAGGGAVTQTQFKAANDRSIRAIKQGVIAYNLAAKYLAEPGQLVSVRSPSNIRQDRGVGGGLPRETIANGAIDASKLAGGAVTREKLSTAVQNALPAWIVKVNNDMGVPVTRQSAPTISMTRLATGTYLSDFGRDVGACSWTATPTIDSGVPTAQTARTMPDPGGDAAKVLTETHNGAGFLVDSGVTVQVVC